MTARLEIADRATDLKTAYLGITLALVPLLDPRVPLLDYYKTFDQTDTSPFEVARKDGTLHSAERLSAILMRATQLHAAGLREDSLSFAAMYGATRLGDDLSAAGLIRKDEPLLQFARHFRNACAHGNRWHFAKNEPAHPAILRGRRLEASLHGTQAMYGWLAPGDYLDFLDDLSTLLRRVSA